MQSFYSGLEVIVSVLAMVFLKQEDSEVTSDEENCLTQDEIQAFVENNTSFYNNRDLYRKHLKEKFTNYCRSTVQSKPVWWNVASHC